MLDDAKIDSFVVKNADYYQEKWRRFHESPRSASSFNNAAFFTAGGWLIYRKLYVPVMWVVLVLVVDFSLSIYLEENRIVSAGAIAAWDRLAPFIYGGVVGTFGNSWYWRKFRRMEIQARSQSPDPSLQHEFLRSKGGTNPIGTGLVLIVLAALIFAPMIFT